MFCFYYEKCKTDIHQFDKIVKSKIDAFKTNFNLFAKKSIIQEFPKINCVDCARLDGSGTLL